jgi:RHS repeat-associated protein
MRVRKQSGAASTEYIYFGGQPIAERNGDATWSDYIYAGGRRLARADSYEDRIWVRATHSGAGQISSYGFQGAQALVGYVIQPGDRLYWRQWQSSTARGGLVVQFTVAPHASWGTYDQDGQQINSDNTTGQWHYRRVDLSPFAGKTINWMWITADSQTLPGAYDMYFQDLALVSADGTVRRIYSRDKSIALTPFSSSGVSGQTYAVNHFPGAGPYVPETTVYYHGDHLGSSRLMTAYEGFPIWEATYLPFGQEHAAGGAPPLAPSSNHYKFTGKERDTESGLDYFGARYYASATGRFLLPDPLYLELKRLPDPQQLNLYAYTRNNPLRFTDPTGLDIAVTGQYSDDYLRLLQKNLSFKIKLDKGKIAIAGDLGKKDLKKLEKSLKGGEKHFLRRSQTPSIT